MSFDEVKRKLAAILSADVEGYSLLMSNDEVGTIRTLSVYRDAMTKLIKQHRGRLVDAPGDNLLAEFVSVVDAVQCAVEIQRDLAHRNQEMPEGKKMHFRIGVNLGDVVEEKKRIYGDGVNIAARLESLCDGGGVCISGAAFEHVENKLALEFEDLGQHEVKNIARPVRVYRVRAYPGAAPHSVINARTAVGKKWRKISFAIPAILILTVAAGILWHFYWRTDSHVEVASEEKMAFPLPDKPSIAVLPFVIMGDDSELEYLSDGTAEQIITGLSVVPNLFVIARQSTFAYKGKSLKIQQIAEELGVRYVLEGSIQKSGGRIRLTSQLIDAIKGHHLWAERYDRDLKDVFALQDEITMKVLTELQVKLAEGEQARLRAKKTDNLQAYLRLMQGVKPFFTMTKRGNALARQIFEEVIALDPEFPQAYNLLGVTYILDVLYGSSKSPQESLEKASELIKKALDLDDTYPEAHAQLGQVYVMQGQHEKGIAESQRAVGLSPNNARAHLLMSSALRFSGRHEEAVRHSEKALRLNPYPPGIYFWYMAAAYTHVGRYEEAIIMCKKALERTPEDLFARLMAAVAYSQAGRKEEATAEVAEILKINPRYSLKEIERLPYKNEADKNLLVNALHKAGLPEKPPLPLPDKPSIAVLPFDNMSDDSKQDYFSDGITEEIITALSKTPKLFVIARNSSFTYKDRSVKVQQVSRDLGVKYVLEGSVRKAGNRLRITAQLIDATSGHHLWAERYDRELKDIFALQDEITKKILSALQIKLTEGEIARWFEKGTNSLEAYLAALKGREFYYRQDREGNSIARNLFQEAVGHDPKYAIAYSWLARTHNMDMWLGSSKSPRESLKQAVKLAQKAIALDENLTDAHSILGYIYTLMRQHEQAIAEGKKAVELAPNSDSARLMYGISLHYFGRRKEAIRLMESAIRLNPMPTSVYYHYLGTAYYHSGRYKEAISAYKKTLQLSPNHQWANLGLAATYSLMGRDKEAREAAAEALRINPQFTIEGLAKRSPYKNQEDIDRMVTALRNAGLK